MDMDKIAETRSQKQIHRELYELFLWGIFNTNTSAFGTSIMQAKS